MIAINRLALIEALNRCAKVTPSKSPVAMLLHACLEFSGGKLTYRATDLTVTVSGSIDAAGDPVSICVNPRELSTVLGSLTGDTAKLDINVDGGSMKISATGRRSFKTRVLPGGDFPRTEAPSGTQVSVPGSQIIEVLKAVMFSVSDTDDAAQAHLKCVRLIGTGEVMSAAATDGRKAAIASTPGGGVIQCLIPEKTASFLLDEIDPALPVAMRSDARNIEFSWGSESICCRTPENRFPPIESVFERELAGSLEVATAVLAESVKAVQCIDANRDVMLQMTPSALRVEAYGDGGGDGCDELTVECSHDLTTACSASALLAALKSCGEKVTISYGSDLDQIKLTSDGFEAIVMPVRLEYVQNRKGK
jgi:DNA polymerase III sliding clamp (beta) subunit (PCNA family)